MMKNKKLFEDWERQWIKASGVDFSRNIRIVEALYKEACGLGIFPTKDPLEGLQTKIDLAKALNVPRNP
jgi:hypothetical protein